MQDTTPHKLLQLLKPSPSTEVWRAVIGYALAGQFEDLIDRLGGIESLIETTIVNSVSPVTARLTFASALNDTITAWQPHLIMPYSTTENTLRLIAAKTPPTGFVKVLGYLIIGQRFRVAEDEASPDELKYLDDLALAALRNYFPVVPSEPAAFPAFDTYVKLLWDRLDLEGFRGHACQRLLELGEITIQDPRLQELLHSFAEDLIPALTAWLLSTHRPERQLLLSHLYLGTRGRSEARELLRAHMAKGGVQLVERGRSSHVILRSGERIDIWMDIQDVELSHLSREWTAEAAQGRFELEALCSREDV